MCLEFIISLKKFCNGSQQHSPLRDVSYETWMPLLLCNPSVSASSFVDCPWLSVTFVWLERGQSELCEMRGGLTCVILHCTIVPQV